MSYDTLKPPDPFEKKYYDICSELFDFKQKCSELLERVKKLKNGKICGKPMKN